MSYTFRSCALSVHGFILVSPCVTQDPYDCPLDMHIKTKQNPFDVVFVRFEHKQEDLDHVHTEGVVHGS